MMLLNCQCLSSTRNPPQFGVRITRETRAKGAERIKRVCENQSPKEKSELYCNQRQPNSTIKPSLYGSQLQSCARGRCLIGGLQVQAHIIKRGFESDWFLQTSLLEMYVKCGRLDFAHMVFDTGDIRTKLISWNSMITFYFRSGFVEEALSMFLELLIYGLQPDHYTLSVVIAVIERHNKLFLGRQIHSLSIRLGYSDEQFVTNSLIQMYGSFGRIHDSLQVYNGICKARNPIAWNSMIAQLVNNEFHEDALLLYTRMQATGIVSTPLTSSSILKACAALKASFEGKQIHALIILNRFLPNVILETALLDLYVKCGDVKNGRRIFDGMGVKNVVTWNSIIRGYSQFGYREEALKLFQMMRREGVIPDKFTFPALLTGFMIGDYISEELKSMHLYIIKAGLTTDRFIGTSLISLYSLKQSIKETRLVFDDTDSTDIGVWSSMISAIVKIGEREEALRLFKDMLYSEIRPNNFIYSSLFTVCCDLSKMEMGKQIHAYSLKSSESFDVAVENSLISMYSNCGCIAKSWKVFDLMENPSVISYNSMISALAQHGHPNRAVELFGRMKFAGLRPDEITLLNLLTAFNHAGFVNEGLELFHSMKDHHGIEPGYEHYACMADMLARGGEIEEAMRFISEMPFEPQPDLWRIILGACGKHQDMKTGKQIAEMLLKLEPGAAVNYVLVANIYARMGKWVEGERVRDLMDERGIEKEVAVSWIEIDRITHTFGVGDRSHPRSEEIYRKLGELIEDIRAAGYVPDISFTVHDMEDERREESLSYHSEKLAFAFGVISTARGVVIRIMKNIRICGDCHEAFKYFSLITGREIIVRDKYRFHHFSKGVCSCGDYW